MDITFILPEANMSGGTRVVAIYARELMLRGHKVRVIAPPQWRMSFSGKIKRWLRGRGWPSENTIPNESYLDHSGVDLRILRERRPVTDRDVPDGDVVIATWWETAEWVNALSLSKGAKVYFIQHHEVFSYVAVERSRATYRLAFHKIVIANWLKRVMEDEYQDANVDLVPNSVDRKQFFASRRTKQPVPTVGLLYALAEFKGLDVALDAVRRVRQRLPQTRLICFGTQSPTQDLPLIEGAEFFPSPPQAEIRQIYSRCDVWITASRSEGFNLPAMEAMACRTPVVSTRTGWPEEAVRSGWNGWLADVGNVDELAHGLEWVLTRSNEEWETLSDNALATVAATSWEISTDLFEQSLRRACERATRGEIAGRGRNQESHL
ncbi:glycosyltransferase family 4 protein [Bradyrhizobium manausense]|uniref:glycosyltransferase family 4 protein n=1 Tax=Bradyrhizobium manausense TaxID=989370 RepID=UPI001BAB7AF1|nr:glycosyltransferase family 4 protein [Bradyrhizobium manausense]